MRIGLIAPTFPPALGGMEEFARNLAYALAATDQVTVFTGLDRGDPAAPFPVHSVLTGHFTRDGRHLAAAEPDIDVWIGMQASMSRLARHLRRPFFVYCYGNDFLNPWEPHALATLVGRSASRLPYVWRRAYDWQSSIKRVRIRRSLRHVRHVFAISQETASRFVQLCGRPASTVTVIPPGVNDAFFQQRGPASPDVLRVLTVCRLPSNTRKNVDGVLRALAMTPEVPAVYTVVGDGDGRPALERLARELGLEHRVRFTGAVDRQTLLQAYREADLFMLASKATTSDIEGFGIVYLEASASGVPVVASRQGGAIDAVTEGQNGLLIPSSSPDDLAAALRAFWQDRTRYDPARVGRVAESFRWPLVARRLRQRLDELTQR